MSDAKFLWCLRNEPAVRKRSFNTKRIAWNGHEDWLWQKIHDSRIVFYLARRGCKPIGQVRFDRNGKKAVINVSISKRFQGRGYGREVLKIATRRYLKTQKVKKVIAYAKVTNFASIRCFEKAGYINTGKVTVQGNHCMQLVFFKESRGRKIHK